MVNKMCFEGTYGAVDQDIANQMNMYFCEIGEKLHDAIPNLGYDYKRYLPIRVETHFPLTYLYWWNIKWNLETKFQKIVRSG